MGITADRFIEILAVRHRVLLLGGLAIIAHGLDRMTKDVDIWLDPMADESVWSEALINALGKAPRARPYDLALKQVITVSGMPQVLAACGVIRIIGLDRPVDVFRKPNNLETVDFEEVWRHASISLGNIRVMDEIDMLLTKEGTQRVQDIADTSFLENKVHMCYERVLPCCSYDDAEKMFARYADAQVCEFALRNPDKRVRALAMKMLDYLAKDGNPYACEIFERYTKAGGYPNDGGPVPP